MVTIAPGAPAFVPPSDLHKAAAGFGTEPVRAEQIEQMSQAMLERMLQSTTGNGPVSALPANRPQLREPSAVVSAADAFDGVIVTRGAAELLDGGDPVGIDPDSLTPDGFLQWRVGQIKAALRDSSVASLMTRVEQYRSLNASAKADAERLSAAFTAAQSEFVAASTAATSGAETVQPLVAEAAEARVKVESLKAKLDALVPTDPDYATTEQAYQVALGAADQLGRQAQQALAPLQGMTERATQAASDLEAVQDEILNLPIPQAGPLTTVRQATLTNAAIYNQLLAVLSEVVEKSGQAKLDSNSDFNLKQLRASQKRNTKGSEEYDKQMEKARATEKTMGCVGKILGWLVTVVSIIAAPFSGGASLALAVVGLALAITTEATGFSLIGKALEPFTKYVLEPLIKELGKAFTEMLEKMGVSPDEAKRIGGILGAVAGAIIVVVVAIVSVVVGRSAGSAVIKALGPVLTRAFKNVLPIVIKQAARQMSQMGTRLTGAVAKSIGTSVEKVTARVVLAQTINTGLQVTGDMVKGAGNVARASGEVDASKTLAALNNGLANNKAIEALMKNLQEEFANMGDFVEELYELVAKGMQGQTRTGKAILRSLMTA
jgi:invasin B